MFWCHLHNIRGGKLGARQLHFFPLGILVEFSDVLRPGFIWAPERVRSELADPRRGSPRQLELPLFLLSLPKPRSASVLRLIAVIKSQPNMH